MVPLIAADLFGEREFSKMVGIFVSVNTAGYALGTPLFNLVYDICGSYLPVFCTIIPVMLLIAVSFHFIINSADAIRRQQEQNVIPQ